jgi:rhodanese-related sulfurtransferase
MKSQYQSALLLFLFFVLGACSEKESSDDAALDVQAFEEAINDTSDKIILDVRTPEEFNEGHIRYAMLADFHSDDFKDRVNKLDKQTPVYVYCASGVRSDKAATIMREQGFKEVYVLAKGFNDWTEQNKEIVK